MGKPVGERQKPSVHVPPEGAKSEHSPVHSPAHVSETFEHSPLQTPEPQLSDLPVTEQVPVH
jgi:hypothetical protein